MPRSRETVVCKWGQGGREGTGCRVSVTAGRWQRVKISRSIGWMAQGVHKAEVSEMEFPDCLGSCGPQSGVAKELRACWTEAGRWQGRSCCQDPGCCRCQVNIKGIAFSSRSLSTILFLLPSFSRPSPVSLHSPALILNWQFIVLPWVRLRLDTCRRDEGSDIVILARTDARQAVSLEEALARAEVRAALKARTRIIQGTDPGLESDTTPGRAPFCNRRVGCQ